MIRNYDTNGLIFIIHPENVDETFESETYRKAVLNVLNSQGNGFFCIPIISHPRIRNNRNDSITRATYEPSEGNVTHIARKGVFDDEDEIVFIPNQEIEHLSGDSSLLEAAKLIFTPNSLGNYNFVVTIDGTKEQPIALFSPDQILQKYCKKELISRLLDLCDQEKTKLLFSITKRIVEGNMDKSELYLAGLSDIDLSNDEIEEYGTRVSGLAVKRASDPICAIDIMNWGACAIKIENQDILDDEIEYLSVKILDEANDFTNFVMIDGNGNVTAKLVRLNNKNGGEMKERRLDIESSRQIALSSDLQNILLRFSKIKQECPLIIVRTDKSILTGEGEMQWPGIITKEQILCAEVFNELAAILTTYEKDMKEILYKSGKKRSIIAKTNLGKLKNQLANDKQLAEKISDFANSSSVSVFLKHLGLAVRVHNKIKHEFLSLNQEYSVKTQRMLELNLPTIGDVKELCREMAIIIEHCKLPDLKTFETPSPTAQRLSPAEMIAESQKPYVEKAKRKSSSNRQSSPSNNPKKPKLDREAIESEIRELKIELEGIPAERLKQHELDPDDIAAKNAITAKEWDLKRKISQLEKSIE